VHIIHDIWIATRVQCYKERVTRMIIADLMLMYQRYRRRRESCRQVLCKFYIGRHKRRLVRQWKSGADAGARRDMIGHVVPVFCLAFLCTKMTQYHADMHENAPRAWNFKKKIRDDTPCMEHKCPRCQDTDLFESQCCIQIYYYYYLFRKTLNFEARPFSILWYCLHRYYWFFALYFIIYFFLPFTVNKVM